jgi:hypothetical protein
LNRDLDFVILCLVIASVTLLVAIKVKMLEQRIESLYANHISLSNTYYKANAAQIVEDSRQIAPDAVE